MDPRQYDFPEDAVNVDMRELSDKATHVAAEAWDQAHGLVSELVERGKDLDVPQRVEHAVEAFREPAQHAVEAVREPAERAAVEVRRRPWTVFAGVGAAIVALVVIRAWWHRRSQREQRARFGSVKGHADPFGPDSEYQDRAVAAVR
jgi:ElaB/YqjD/DUF883 family membrane-anchored ribosome-binding protein